MTGICEGVSAIPGAANGPCELSFGATAGLRQLTIGNEAVRAEILLDKGASVRQFWHGPTGARTLAETEEWAERLAEFHRSGCRGSSYSDCYEGGWQDVLPARAQWDGGAIGDGSGVGEAAIVPWEIMRSVCTPAAAHVVCRARLPRCGLEVMKRFGVRRGVATLRVETTVLNASDRELRFNWTQHPALGGDVLDETSRIWLPGGRARVQRQQDGGYTDHDGTGGANGVNAGWLTAAALLPAGSTDAFTTFADVSRGDAALLSSRRGVGVSLRWDVATFPHAWLWSSRRPLIHCVTVEPSTTYLPELSPRREPELMRLLRPGESIQTWVELSSFTLASRLARNG